MPLHRLGALLLLLTLGVPRDALAQERLDSILTFESPATGAGVVEWDLPVASLDSAVARSGEALRITHDEPEDETDPTFAYPTRLTGRQLELRGWVRTESLSGSAALWISANGMDDGYVVAPGVSGTTEWALHSLRLPLTAPVDFVHFGAEVKGSGSAWIDDLVLSLDGRPLSGAVEGTLSNRGCMFADHRFGGGLGGSAFEFDFSPGTGFRDDGRGPYRAGVDGVETYVENSGIRLYPYGRGGDPSLGPRAVTVDLGRPLDGGPSHGPRELEAIVVHWKQDSDRRLISGLLDMPIGAVERSERMEIFVTIDGRRHLLRFGEMDVRACWIAASVDGAGSTEPILHRVSETQWTVELPAGSAGRLSEWYGDPSDASTGHFERRGLYGVTGRFTIRWLKQES